MLQLYNTQSRRKEEITAGEGNAIRLYTCGPTAHVDIDRLSKEAHRHRRALDVPAGTAWAKGALPKNFPIALGIIGLPKCKI